MANPNKDTTLEFILVSEINGIKYAKLVEEDIKEEIVPPFEVILGYVRRIWKDFAINKVILIKKGLYLVRFMDYQDAMKVTQKGVYQFDHKPFIVKAWTMEMEISTDAIVSLLIWIQLPELDIKFWGFLSKLGSMLGIPLKTDKHTKEKSTLKTVGNKNLTERNRELEHRHNHRIKNSQQR
ncbi:LOW QUALITY PROTEIN: hypothetical protein Cgig2_005394 [Carnegiea gigantea]|uniref:DUF4283 domain-containing protein n=1 Tax=Carnegiea gigantea TaxID=171969 RepID=A0A9Q1JEC0_9CARY|nr:LOW QUALITY PROTEIN: hypothetical protein Cgig2_005394 [Carnegiea gigantea]